LILKIHIEFLFNLRDKMLYYPLVSLALQVTHDIQLIIKIITFLVEWVFKQAKIMAHQLDLAFSFHKHAAWWRQVLECVESELLLCCTQPGEEFLDDLGDILKRIFFHDLAFRHGYDRIIFVNKCMLSESVLCLCFVFYFFEIFFQFCKFF